MRIVTHDGNSGRYIGCGANHSAMILPVRSLADLDPGGGRSDIVWQHDDGLVAAWQMDGVAIIGQANLLNPGAATHVVGAKNFDGNGGADILLQNDNGQLLLWLMQDATHILAGGQVTIGQNPGAPWHAIAGDFNGDGRAGILFTTASGHTAIWEDFVSTGPGQGRFDVQANLPNNGPSWHVKATGDFDGDDKDDILWQNDNGLAASSWTARRSRAPTTSPAARPTVRPGTS